MASASGRGTQDPRIAYGEELRVRREAAGLTQQALSDVVIVSPSMIAHIEAGRRKPRPDDAARLDRALGTDGFFVRFLPTLNVGRFAAHFTVAADAEARATVIQFYAATLIPGILQTKDYASAVLRSAHPNFRGEDVDTRVVNRIERAQILADPDGPVVWAVLSENVLRTVVGGPLVMAEQLRRVAALGRSGRVHVQVIPHAAGAHATMTGMMTLMRFHDEPDAVYAEALYTGSFVDDQVMVQQYKDAYQMALAVGLSPEESLRLIESVAEEYERHGLAAHT